MDPIRKIKISMPAKIAIQFNDILWVTSNEYYFLMQRSSHENSLQNLWCYGVCFISCFLRYKFVQTKTLPSIAISRWIPHLSPYPSNSLRLPTPIRLALIVIWLENNPTNTWNVCQHQICERSRIQGNEKSFFSV